MKEIFEKIKERLGERLKFYENRFAEMGGTDRDVEDWGSIKSYKDAIRIVNEVAEEYGKDTNVPSNDGWIPCSEKTPEFEIYSVTKLWVTMHRKGCAYYFVRTLRWNGWQGRWEWDNGKQLSDAYEVVAWRQFDVLKPYKPEGEKDGKTENN